MSLFLYYDLLWIFCHSALYVDQPLPLVVYASYRVCLTVMLCRAARVSSWAVPSAARPSATGLFIEAAFLLATIRGRPSVPPPALLRVDRWPSVRVDLAIHPVVRCARSHLGPVAARAVDSGSDRWVMHVRSFPGRSTRPVRSMPRARAV